MKQSLKIVWITVFLVFLFGQVTVEAQIQTIKQIHIVSNWVGLGPSGHSELVIERKSDGYRAKGKRIDDGLVRDLLEALNAPPMSPNLSNLGITQNWLDVNATIALRRYSAERHEKAAENQRALFSIALRDISLIEKLMPGIIGGYWTDDYPSFQMEILKSDGQSVIVSSQEQHIFMLPLVISTDGQEIRTYNANISRAIANLLPLKFTNRERFSGSRLLYDVTGKVMLEIEKQWNWLDTENKIGNELDVLKDKYVLKETAISHLSSIDVGAIISRWKPGDPSFPSWNAELQRKDLPANVVIGVSLPFQNGKLRNFDIFREKIDGFVSQALSVQWLAEYIKTHPEYKFEIRFVNDRSFSDKGEDGFWNNMKKGGKQAQANEIAGLLPQGTFLEINERERWSRWLVLPDKRMVLWDFRGESVLKWKASEFETWTRYGERDWYGAFAIISADGEIQAR